MYAEGGLRRLDVSLSARRAWIEMCVVSLNYKEVLYVALRKESVDRNVTAFDVLAISAVALRKESVDRNLAWHCISEDVSCRSPQGERG